MVSFIFDLSYFDLLWMILHQKELFPTYIPVFNEFRYSIQ